MTAPRYAAYRNSGVKWLGDIPAHWEVLQSRRMFAVRSEPALPTDQMLTASQKYGVLFQKDFVEMEGRRVAEVIMGTESLKHVEPGDFIISMRSFQGGLEWSRLRGSTSFHYVMVKPVKGVHQPFFAHLFKSVQYIHALRSTTDLIRDGQELRYSNFVQVDLPLVPIEEQVAIAAFLDRETAKIDALVEEQLRLINLLKEKREAVISRAVAKGLNPNAPMKDSGVKWLGKLPAHWGITKLKHLVAESVAGPYGASLTKDMYTSSGYRVYGQQQVIPDDFTVGDYYISEAKFDEMRRYSVNKGDVLVSVMGTIGRVAVVPGDAEPGIINPRLVRYRCGERIQPRYLQRVLLSQTHQEHLLFEAKGTTMDGLNMSTLGSVPVPVPPLAEQAQIVEWLSSIQDETDSLVVEAEKAAALLLERRASLISAAVTGKIDVRGLVPQREALAA